MPQLMNLESQAAMAPLAPAPVSEMNLELGSAEYVLFTLWLMFTFGVFSLLYKVTKMAN